MEGYKGIFIFHSKKQQHNHFCDASNMCMTYHISGMTFKTNGTFLLLLNERVVWEWECQSGWQWYVNKSDMNGLFPSISKGSLISDFFSLWLKCLKKGAKSILSNFFSRNGLRLACGTVLGRFEPKWKNKSEIKQPLVKEVEFLTPFLLLVRMLAFQPRRNNFNAKLLDLFKGT